MFPLIIQKGWMVASTPIELGEITFHLYDLIWLVAIGTVVGTFLKLEYRQGMRGLTKHSPSKKDKPKPQKEGTP